MTRFKVRLNSRDRRLWELGRVMEFSTLSRGIIYKMMSEGDFPKPIKLGHRRVAWIASDVESWLDNRIARSRAHDTNQD